MTLCHIAYICVYVLVVILYLHCFYLTKLYDEYPFVSISIGIYLFHFTKLLLYKTQPTS